jgi:hypothetical protein
MLPTRASGQLIAPERWPCHDLWCDRDRFPVGQEAEAVEAAMALYRREPFPRQ